MLFTSWKHLYSELASQAPTIKDNAPFAQFLDKDDLPESCKRTLATAADCATLMAYSKRATVWILHHFHVDVRTPLNPDRSGEAWALVGNGTGASPVAIPATIWDAVEGIMPPFTKMCAVKNAEDFAALGPPSSKELQEGPNLQFGGKRMIVLPPFLTKVLMEVDSDNAITLLVAPCKVLCDFDLVAVEAEVEEDAGDVLSHCSVSVLGGQRPHDGSRRRRAADGLGKHLGGICDSRLLCQNTTSGQHNGRSIKPGPM